MGRERQDRSSSSTELSSGPRTVAEARWFVAKALEDEEIEVDPETALILTSEVATNAVKHGKEPIELSISLEQEGLRVSVFDRGPGFDPAEVPAGNPDAGGWGLQLVDSLSSEWGVDRRDDGTEVWFRV
jgi:anti-sigma regulatory factor (Ser/Thr protein kinase)